MRRALFTLFLLFSLAGSARPAHALTLADVRSQIRLNIRDTAASAAQRRYADADLNSLINEAQRDVVSQTGCLRATTVINLVGGTTYYGLPTDTLSVLQARYKNAAGTSIELPEISKRKLIQDFPDFEHNFSGSIPYEYFVQTSTSGASQLEIGIVPAARTSTGTITLDYLKQPADLAADSDVPLAGFRVLYPYHSALVFYVTYRIRLIEGFPDATTYAQAYAQMIAEMARLGDMPNYNPSAKPGHP